MVLRDHTHLYGHMTANTGAIMFGKTHCQKTFFPWRLRLEIFTAYVLYYLQSINYGNMASY